jgi:hypothetical protein
MNKEQIHDQVAETKDKATEIVVEVRDNNDRHPDGSKQKNTGTMLTEPGEIKIKSKKSLDDYFFSRYKRI